MTEKTEKTGFLFFFYYYYLGTWKQQIFQIFFSC